MCKYVYTIGHEDINNNFYRSVFGEHCCVRINVEYEKYTRNSQLNLYLKDTVNEGHNRNDLHTKDKFGNGTTMGPGLD